jgi:hypothetical protein
LGCALALRNKPRVLKGEKTSRGRVGARKGPNNRMVGRNFEAYPSIGRQSAWEEEGGSTRQRHLGQALKRTHPKSIAAGRHQIFGSSGDDVVGGSNPLKHPERWGRQPQDLRAEQDAGGAVSDAARQGVLWSPAVWQEHEGKTDREVTSLPDGVDAQPGEPQERCGLPCRADRQVARGEKRQRRLNVRGAMSRGWQPGAAVRTVGRFVRLERAEGEENPMGGGVRNSTEGAGHTARAVGSPADTGHTSEGSWRLANRGLQGERRGAYVSDHPGRSAARSFAQPIRRIPASRVQSRPTPGTLR